MVSRLRSQNLNKLDGKIVFNLYETYGFPPEVTKDLAIENGIEVDLTEFDKLFKLHQEKSRQGSEQKFKGGLAEQNEKNNCIPYSNTSSKCCTKRSNRKRFTSKRI